MKKILKKLLSRSVLVSCAILLQVTWFAVLLYCINRYNILCEVLLSLLSLVVVVRIINRDDNPGFKLAWIIPILLLPWFGGVLYLITGGKLPTKKMRTRVRQMTEAGYGWILPCDAVIDEIEREDAYVASQFRYLQNMNYPVYYSGGSRYYAMGEDAFPDMLADMQAAQKFIFLEYFIVHEGVMWDQIHEVLRQKAAEGVEIRFIFDDFGSITLSEAFVRQLEAEGIRCYVFNPYIPLYSVVMNNRDHRKMLIIDGHIGYTGGTNIADEYINRLERFGVWKDGNVRIEGSAVRSMTLMFLNMWNVKKGEEPVYEARFFAEAVDTLERDGYAAPYGHSPYDGQLVAERVYLNIINHAREYVYIYTPYLGLDHEMQTALVMAAKRGVDVRLVTPGIPDKKIVNQLTKSEYGALLKAGCTIYEYTPGFDHAKCFVCDDRIATVGTINLDYRSLYHHFENGIFFYHTKVPQELKADFENTIVQCRKVDRAVEPVGFFESLWHAVLRLFSPLM